MNPRSSFRSRSIKLHLVKGEVCASKARGEGGSFHSVQGSNVPRPFALARGTSSSESEDILNGNGGSR